MINLALTSDTHGTLEWVNEVPQCDILVHAGDICLDTWKGISCRADLGRSALWITEEFIPAIQYLIDEGIIRHFVATLGNHDWVTRKEAKNLSTDQIHFLVDEELECMGLKFWGSPWSNEFKRWAWMQLPENLARVYQHTPDVDVFISHQPPLGAGSRFWDIGDNGWNEVGSKELNKYVLGRENPPKLLVCGHIHGGHGIYKLDKTLVVNAAYLGENYKPMYSIEQVQL